MNLVSTATSDSVTFSWMAPVDANGLLLRYIVDIISSTSIGSAGTGSFIISPSAESFSLSGSNPNIVYFFTIAASNSLGVGVTVPLSTTTEPLGNNDDMQTHTVATINNLVIYYYSRLFS